MKNDKLSSYLGFAAKAGKLQRGYNTCLSLIDRNKVKLLIVCEDSTEGTVKKMTDKARSRKTDYRVFGRKDEISRVTGSSGNSVYAITDDGFAEVIKKEIDRVRSEGEMSNDNESV